MPGRGAESWQGGLRAHGGSNPHLSWSSSIKPHLLLSSDALLVSLSPGWVVQVLEGLCRRRGAAGGMAAASLWKGLVGLGLFALAHAAFSAAQREWGGGGGTAGLGRTGGGRGG